MSYQAPVNHRLVKIADIVCLCKVNDEVYGPFMECLASGATHLQLDKNTVISLWFHGLEAGDDKVGRLQSHYLFHASKDEGGIEGDGFGFCYIKGRHVKELNGNVGHR